jgi:hypothetical protein
MFLVLNIQRTGFMPRAIRRPDYGELQKDRLPKNAAKVVD